MNLYDGMTVEQLIRLRKADCLLITQLQDELIAAREENEQLMNVEYWPERCRDAEKQRDKYQAALKVFHDFDMVRHTCTTEDFIKFFDKKAREIMAIL